MGSVETVIVSPPALLKPAPLLTEGATESLEYPLEALGDILGTAASDIFAAIQCPKSIAGQAVLGTAALAAQGLANIEIDGRRIPLSLNLITIAESGDRKSAADNIATQPIHEMQKDLILQYESDKKEHEVEEVTYLHLKNAVLKGNKKSQKEISSELAALEKPTKPVFPIFLCQEPTLEGIQKSFRHGLPSQGLFSDEGGQFFGGYSMNAENALKTMAGLSLLWDGSPLTRTRSSDEIFALYDRRFSSHLLIQPIVAAKVLADPLLQGQGLLARFLIADSKSLAGTRFYKPINANDSHNVLRYKCSITRLLKNTASVGDQGGLELARLILDADAKALWQKAHDAIEAKLGEGADLEIVKPTASKMAENIARISGVLAVVEESSSVSIDHVKRAIVLGNYYLNEAQRLGINAQQDEGQARAQLLLNWIDKRGGKLTTGEFTRIPRKIKARSFKAARHLLNILVDAGHLEETSKNTKGQPAGWRRSS